MAAPKHFVGRTIITLALAYIAFAVAIAIRSGNSIHQSLRMPLVMLVFWGSSQMSAVVRTCRSMALPDQERRLKEFHERIEISKMNLKKRGYVVTNK
ncbi:putative transmembrane protein [Gregarina niphandrodes]|uniref:Transmembrane protein n=1 Tax=Gregarina niphandrodes TaxID=110365 RepID=A0A023B621_GRENI|nr:putative transmembrane protein [Gregarina niphandrodes]EZG62788.1 putative transmembrane protein [Gregarina niphandrodes]|eukprot:XP_011130709.1 putative transmembrane protein [Gregarina niphandrodes]